MATKQTKTKAPAKPVPESVPVLADEPKIGRAQKAANIILANGPVELASTEPTIGEFTCICGGHGKKAFPVKQGSKTILVGETCLAHLGLALPKKERKIKAKHLEIIEVAGEPVEVESVTDEEIDSILGLESIQI